MCDMPMSAKSSKMSKEQMDYRAEDDFRTLQRGAEVQGDSTRHARALAHGRKQIATISKVVGRGKVGVKAGRAPKRMPRRV